MKKWLCVLCASVFCLSVFLSACVTNDPSVQPTEPASESGTEPAAPSTEPTTEPTEEPTEPAPQGPTTFSRWFKDNALIGRIPALITKSSLYGEVLDVGDKWYQLDVHNTTLEDYWAYLDLLKENGYDEYVSNGENGLDNAVFSTTLTKGDDVVTVCFMTKMETVYVTAKEGAPLSPKLFYDAEDVAKNQPGAVNKLTMRELVNFGNGFVFQLKNGHFIVWDNGTQKDGYYLVDYLESCVPEGEKPVIEAIMISHDHSDHGGFLNAFIMSDTLPERVIVNGLYYNWPSERVIAATNSDRALLQTINMMRFVLKDENGNAPKMYRPMAGQQYYFNDVEFDVVWSQEYIPYESQTGDMNDTSTHFYVLVDGQRFLTGGDGESGEMTKLMQVYSKEYLKPDLYQILHHGYNTWNLYTDWIGDWSNVVCIDSAPIMRSANAANQYLRDRCAEWINWGDGSVVLTFPYKVGSYVRLPKIDLTKYNN